MNLVETAQKTAEDWWDRLSLRKTSNGLIKQTNGQFAQENLRTALIMYKAVKDSNIDSQFLRDFPRKCGYGIIGGNDGIPTGIKSIRLERGIKPTKDHVFGATLAGEEVFKAFEEWDYDIEYMVNTWLKNNLYFFATIAVTKEEHNRLKSNGHTKNQKRNLQHYEECGIVIEYKDISFRGKKEHKKAYEFFNFTK